MLANVTNLAVFTVHKRLAKRGKYKAKNFSTHIITRMGDEKCLVKWYAKFSLQRLRTNRSVFHRVRNPTQPGKAPLHRTPEEENNYIIYLMQ